jgi:hypothetical protein
MDRFSRTDLAGLGVEELGIHDGLVHIPVALHDQAVLPPASRRSEPPHIGLFPYMTCGPGPPQAAGHAALVDGAASHCPRPRFKLCQLSHSLSLKTKTLELSREASSRGGAWAGPHLKTAQPAVGTPWPMHHIDSGSPASLVSPATATAAAAAAAAAAPASTLSTMRRGGPRAPRLSETNRRLGAKNKRHRRRGGGGARLQTGSRQGRAINTRRRRRTGRDGAGSAGRGSAGSGLQRRGGCSAAPRGAARGRRVFVGRRSAAITESIAIITSIETAADECVSARPLVTFCRRVSTSANCIAWFCGSSTVKPLSGKHRTRRGVPYPGMRARLSMKGAVQQGRLESRSLQ